MLIAAYIRTVYVPSRILLDVDYQKVLLSVTKRFSAYMGRSARLSDLTVTNICGFLCQYATAHSPRSTNNQRQALLSVWQDAADRTDVLPLLSALPERRKIRKLPEELDPPECWSAEEVERLMAELAAQRGTICGVDAGLWWLSFGASIYQTSTRVSSMLAVAPAAFDGIGLLVRKQKNHRPQWFRLSPECCELIRRTHPERRELIWQHPWHPDTIWNKFRRIVEAAGLPAPKTGMQLFHRLRRTTITLCAQVDPALAQRTAGHKEWSTTETHYVDPRKMNALAAVDVLPDPLIRLVGGQPSSLPPQAVNRLRIFG